MRRRWPRPLSSGGSTSSPIAESSRPTPCSWCAPGTRGSKRRPGFRRRRLWTAAARVVPVAARTGSRSLLPRCARRRGPGAVRAAAPVPHPDHQEFVDARRARHGAECANRAADCRWAVVGTITVIEDVTERIVNERELRSQIVASERARAAAENASRLKDEFLATLSHEIRTPLNAVLGWSQILRTENGLKSRTHALEVIERNARAQLKLVEDLLDMARVLSGKLRMEAQPVDVREVASAAIDVVAPAAAAKKISINADIDADVPPVSGDADRLQQAIWNLLSNAVKFTQAGGRIDVRLSQTGGDVELMVRDTGQGIEPDFLPYRVRPVPPGRCLREPPARGTRSRTGSRPADRRAARRHGLRRQPWQRQRDNVFRPNPCRRGHCRHHAARGSRHVAPRTERRDDSACR